MTERQRFGRMVLLIYIAGMLCISLGVIVTYAATTGMLRLPIQIGRFALTLALCVWLYRGSNAACWAAVALTSIAGAMGVSMALSAESNAAFAFAATLSAFYLSFGTMLMASTQVDEFRAFQRCRTR